MRERGGYHLRGGDCERFCSAVPRQDCRSHKPESSVLDLDAEGLRESVAARLRGLREKPTLILKTSSQPTPRISDHVLFTLSLA